MNEALLQFIWQYSLYKPGELQTVQGEKVNVIFPGKLNRDAGPDFLEAKIKVGNTTLAGNIELHINSSDWLKHGHQNDPAYKNLILHVVYKNDTQSTGVHTPLLEIAKHIPQYVIAQYSSLLQTTRALPCAGQLHTVKDIVKESWLNRLLAERWEEKLGDWKELLAASANDWRNLLYWRMAANFGFKVNAQAFLMLARSLPLNVLAKHKDLLQVEALLFGQAGMLEASFRDSYPQKLQEEYRYLKQKYKLQALEAHQWKFLRMRPANFPSIRIAQFAALVHKSLHLFSQIIEIHTIKEIAPLLDVTASEYWDTHFVFDEEANKTPSAKHLGDVSVHNIIINTIAPIQFLYAYKQGLSSQQEKALQLLDTVPAEKNKIIRFWDDSGWKAINAAQSQSLLQLYNNYCSSKRCLECSIGLNIIRSAPVKA